MGFKYTNKALASEKGTAILIALALIAMLSAVAIMSVDRSTTDIELSYNQLSEEKAFYSAEAGLVRAMVELNKDSDWRGPLKEEKIDDGIYAVVILDSVWNPALGDTILARATGKFQGSTVNLEVWLAPGYIYPFKHAAYGDSSLRLEGNACTDSYDSDSGTYAGTWDSIGGDVGSNGEILLKNTVTVGGNAGTSESGAISIINDPDIKGDTSSKADPQTLDYVSDADYTWAKNNNDAPSGFTGKGYQFKPGPNDLLVESNQQIILESGTYYFTSLHLKNKARIKLKPGAEVKIYVTGNILLENFAQMNKNGKPTDMAVYSSAKASDGKTAKMKNGVEFNGLLYAPEIDFLHDNDASIYGAVMAKSIKIKANACIHYDRALSRVATKKSDKLQTVAWRQM